MGNPTKGRKKSSGRAPVRQAAAVCYRATGDAIEFLLVDTNRGRWTFPKGYINGHGDRATALREALEEAGAVGDIAAEPFCSYLHSKGVFWKQSELQEFLVRAYLMEVVFTVSPAEELRNPTWFAAAAAKEKLLQGRELKYQRELEGVIEQALVKIRENNQSNHRRVS